ncbi:hypothetical protein GIB67_011096 [Kingdonia uniflora]|uniref:Uncharacterized protein n=1 Tax=Kingdonia uniflora TaxID=39325 RepID=A0A7J7PA56_9MAGN|nr:hypothetical protein GIB67_011096 [Kingdonia uniflora]
MRKMKANLARSDCISTKAGRLGKRGAQACVKTMLRSILKRGMFEHDRMRDLAYIQYNRRLKSVMKNAFLKEIDPIVLKSFDECAEWLVPDDARDDIVLGTDMTYGVLEDAEDGFDDPPLLTTYFSH